jgi:hypothetical protein
LESKVGWLVLSVETINLYLPKKLKFDLKLLSMLNTKTSTKKLIVSLNKKRKRNKSRFNKKRHIYLTFMKE